MGVSIRIEREDDGQRGRYVFASGEGVAETTYRHSSTGKIIIDHTSVPEVFRGKGVGVALLEQVVEDARKKGTAIIPLCPFAAAQFRRHPAWADVLDKDSKGVA